MFKYCLNILYYYLTIYFLSITKKQISLCVLQVVAYVELTFFILRLYYKRDAVFSALVVFFTGIVLKRGFF